jgi:anti-sigma B factor antagonist
VLECAQLLGITTYCWPDGRALLRVVGDLDTENAPQLFETVVDLDLKAGQRVAVELSGVTYLDSVGASVLVACETVTREHACTFRVSSASLQARAVLELIGLDGLVDGPWITNDRAPPTLTRSSTVSSTPRTGPTANGRDDGRRTAEPGERRTCHS